MLMFFKIIKSTIGHLSYAKKLTGQIFILDKLWRSKTLVQKQITLRMGNMD